MESTSSIQNGRWRTKATGAPSTVPRSNTGPWTVRWIVCVSTPGGPGSTGCGLMMNVSSRDSISTHSPSNR